MTDTTTRTRARHAYETLEPFHILTYFNPGLGAAQADTGLDPHAFYVGARAAPMGDAHPSVVSAAFYNFAPNLMSRSWLAAREVGLDKVAARRYAMLDEQLRAILDDPEHDPVIAELAAYFPTLVANLPLNGRPLAAAWAASDVPEAPHLALWHAVSVLREWRGDNHIAVLVNHDLDGIDAGTFHEAELSDPAIRRRIMGRRLSQLTRGWSDDEWEASVDRLADRGLAQRTESGHRLTDLGMDVYRQIEEDTDARSAIAWASADADEPLARIRPYVKSILDAGVLPGTRKRDRKPTA